MSNYSKKELVANLVDTGNSYIGAGMLEMALFNFKKATAIAPEHIDAKLCLGHSLHLLAKYEDALTVYDQLLAEHPTIAAAWNNRGTTLLATCNYKEAADSFLRAIEIMPDLQESQVALATCYHALGMVVEAEKVCDLVIANNPEQPEAHWNRSLLLLLKGEYLEGWHEYEWRWKKRDFTSPKRNFKQPEWQGEEITGKTLLIHAEQGFGDTLQFCRYIPIVAALGAEIIFECHEPLVSLMKSSFQNIYILPFGAKLPSFDLHIPLLSLAAVFGTTLDTIPQQIPYLKAPPEKIKFWQKELADDSAKIKIGICWSGKSYPDPERSCPVELLSIFYDLENVSFYSLQMERKGHLPFKMRDETTKIKDFGDTAALIAEMDLVITIDTSMAHLAGAFGKRGWVMLTSNPDWRWLTKREDSPWYPTLRLFRQNLQAGWVELIKAVKKQLQTNF